MNNSDNLTRFNHIFAFVVLTAIWSVVPGNLQAAEPETPAAGGIGSEQLFASPDEAVKALQAAVAAKDQAALEAIFGPAFRELLTGDKVQDAENQQRFATILAQGCNPVKESEDRITLEVGTNDWPMPIPLIRTNEQWYFDTAAGKEEILNRHIGKDELCAIGVCRVYVTAQKQYAGETLNASGEARYAQKFKSTPGKKDGLYWPAGENEVASPFGPLVAEAQAEGYRRAKGAGPHPFHGYYFRILTRQGEAAPGGKMNYLSHGNLTKGFALVAYPVLWDQSGVMTFIVNQDGKIYEQNLGENTLEIARAMKAYNPDDNWELVTDDGVLDAASEK